MSAPLRVVRASQIRDRPADHHPWLIEPLWGAGAVGVIGGAPNAAQIIVRPDRP